MAPQSLVKGRHQGSALTTGGDVSVAKIGHHPDATQFGEQSRLVDLQRIAGFTVDHGAVAHGLAMRPDGLNVARLKPLGLQQVLHHFGVEPGQCQPRALGQVQFIWRGLVQSQEAGAQGVIEGGVGVGQAQGAIGVGEVGQHAIDPIERSARHQADEQPAHGLAY